MRLFIAEKKSLADAIASALPQPITATKEFYKSGDDVVTWAAGHILKMLYPDEIEGGKYKVWDIKSLPIIPKDWESLNIPTPETKNLFNNIKNLLKTADCVVNAGDADREGQLLVDEILRYCNYKKPVKRLLLTDLSSAAIKKSIENMKDNQEYIGVYHAGLGRQRADWLIGQNLTRAYTITTKRKKGEIVSVGRVQTPTLALVVHRDSEIENFKPIPYYVAKGKFEANEQSFLATWKPKEDTPGLNPDGKIIDIEALNRLNAKLSGKMGVVTKYNKKISHEAPPKPHSLPSLQIEANEKYGFAPAETLALCQKLYEARILSYPRSDCRYLPVSVFENRKPVFELIKKITPELAFIFNTDDFNCDLQRNTVFNDSKIEEHYAIVPTAQASQHQLTEDEQKIYYLAARAFVAQFVENKDFNDIEIEICAEDEQFIAHSKVCIRDSWAALYRNDKKDVADSEEAEDITEDKLPQTEKDAQLHYLGLEHLQKTTKAPKYYTEATLLEAMNNIHKYVADEKIKAVLKEVQGIGTAATQARTIEELLGSKRQYLKKDGKNIKSTEKGRTLIASVNSVLTNPDLTALWEMKLAQIAKQELSLDSFMQEVEDLTENLVKHRQQTAQQVMPDDFSNEKSTKYKSVLADCPICKQKDGLIQLNGKNGAYWRCKNCNITLSDEKGKPQKVKLCTKCKKSYMVRRKSQFENGGYYWKCKECGATETEKKK